MTPSNPNTFAINFLNHVQVVRFMGFLRENGHVTDQISQHPENRFALWDSKDRMWRYAQTGESKLDFAYDLGRVWGSMQRIPMGAWDFILTCHWPKDLAKV